MWFKKKTDLEKLIISYGRDQGVLLEFARTVARPRIEECTLKDVKAYYTAVVEPVNSLHRRIEMMKAVRKFFREYRGQNILKSSQIRDNPLKSVEEIAIVERMPENKKNKVGRPPNLKMIEKVKVLREQGGLTFRQIAAAIGEDVRQAHLWYTASKNKA